MDSAVYRFGQYALDADRRRLSHDGQRVDVEPQALELLCHLVEHRGRVVPEDELRDRMGHGHGHGHVVSGAALAAALRTARLANHLFTADDPAWPTFLTHLYNFLSE